MNHSLPASTTTTVRLYALTHLHTHTPYYAIRNRSEMFDLSRSFLAQIAAEQKKVWFLTQRPKTEALLSIDYMEEK
jgi:hypothetical protein